MELVTLRIMRTPEVLATLGVSRMTLWRMVQAGIFPKPIRVSARCVGWMEREVQVWVEKKAANARRLKTEQGASKRQVQ